MDDSDFPSPTEKQKKKQSENQLREKQANRQQQKNRTKRQKQTEDSEDEENGKDTSDNIQDSGDISDNSQDSEDNCESSEEEIDSDIQENFKQLLKYTKKIATLHYTLNVIELGGYSNFVLSQGIEHQAEQCQESMKNALKSMSIFSQIIKSVRSTPKYITSSQGEGNRREDQYYYRPPNRFVNNILEITKLQVDHFPWPQQRSDKQLTPKKNVEQVNQITDEGVTDYNTISNDNNNQVVQYNTNNNTTNNNMLNQIIEYDTNDNTTNNNQVIEYSTDDNTLFHKCYTNDQPTNILNKTILQHHFSPQQIKDLSHFMQQASNLLNTEQKLVNMTLLIKNINHTSKAVDLVQNYANCLAKLEFSITTRQLIDQLKANNTSVCLLRASIQQQISQTKKKITEIEQKTCAFQNYLQSLQEQHQENINSSLESTSNSSLESISNSSVEMISNSSVEITPNPSLTTTSNCFLEIISNPSLTTPSLTTTAQDVFVVPDSLEHKAISSIETHLHTLSEQIKRLNLFCDTLRELKHGLPPARSSNEIMEYVKKQLAYQCSITQLDYETTLHCRIAEFPYLIFLYPGHLINSCKKVMTALKQLTVTQGAKLIEIGWEVLSRNNFLLEILQKQGLEVDETSCKKRMFDHFQYSTKISEANKQTEQLFEANNYTEKKTKTTRKKPQPKKPIPPKKQTTPKKTRKRKPTSDDEDDSDYCQDEDQGEDEDDYKRPNKKRPKRKRTKKTTVKPRASKTNNTEK